MITIWEQAIAEFVGTFALVFIGTGAVMLDGSAGLLGVALAFGLVLAIMVSALGHISGAHFNPAVTIGAWVGGKIESMRAGLYILVQLVAATAASLVLRALLPSLVWKGTHLGATLVTKQLPGFGAGKAVILEAILTFFLMLTVYATAIDDRGAFSKIAGLAIGLVLTMDILVGGLLTGASMNPARSFGPALVSGTWTDFWVFVIGPIAGAVLAAALYSFAFLRDRQVTAPREEVPIGGGPEEDLP